MHTAVLVAVLAAACLLSACGFVPPAPAQPNETPRVAINRGDPRLVEAIARPTAGPGPSDQPGNSDATEPALTTTQASISVATPLSEAPPKANSDIAAADISPKHGSQPSILDAETVIETNIPADPVSPPEPVIIKEMWRISPEDSTVRQALTRWAEKAGWTFGPDQWELNFDLPVQAPAEFEAESFQAATQSLSQAIAMTESPVRPCFYANRVLRMIPFTRNCHRALTTPPSH